MELNWSEIGQRFRSQRESLGMTREMMAEVLDITPKFCADIELGAKGMSVQTLCKISNLLSLPTDYILFGSKNEVPEELLSEMLSTCSPEKLPYLETILQTFLQALKT